MFNKNYILAFLASAGLLILAIFDPATAVAGALIAPAAALTLDDIPDLAQGLKNATDSVEKKYHGLEATMRDLEQRLMRRSGGDDSYFGEPESLGAQVAEMDLRHLSAGARGKISLNVKAITTAAGSGGAFVEGQRVFPSPLLRRRPSMRDVLIGGTTGSNAIEYPRRTSRTNGAAMQVEGQLKGESGLTYELIVAPIRTLATWIPASKQVLDDSEMLKGLVNFELRRNLRDVEEWQLLSGDGTGVNIDGVIAHATAFAAPFTIATPTMIDTLLLALAQLETNTENEGTFIAVNPLDWHRIRSLKATDGNYLSGSPFTASDIERLWSLPVVATPAMTVDKFLVGDGMAAQVFDRQQATIEVSTEDRDNFIRNMVTIRAEERLSLAIYRPGGFVFGEFGAA